MPAPALTAVVVVTIRYTWANARAGVPLQVTTMEAVVPVTPVIYQISHGIAPPDAAPETCVIAAKL